ncbi:MAG: hypothetical protein ACSHXK_00020 [Oceanococcus sp.]
MSKADLSALEADLGNSLDGIAGLKGLDQADVDRIQALMNNAIEQQKRDVAEASEQALKHVPALLRGAVRKLLFR